MISTSRQAISKEKIVLHRVNFVIMELKKHVLDLKGSLGSKFVACLALISSNNHTNSNRKAKI